MHSLSVKKPISEMKFSDPLILYFKQKSVHNEDADDLSHHLDDSVGRADSKTPCKQLFKID